MSRRGLAGLTAVAVCLLGFQAPAAAAEPASGLAAGARSAIVMELETGTVLFEKNADEAVEPASVTKIMTMALVLEDVEAGKIGMDDLVTASRRAKEMGGTQINLDEGEQMTVYDLMMAVAVASANDAALALGEYAGGSEEAFVERMNRKAAQLGMTQTHFENPNGLPAEGHVTSARDVALMSRFLLSFDQAAEFTGTDRYPIRSGEDEYMMRNSNALVREYDGCIGLKTGYTQSAGHCLSAAAVRDGMTVIAVVMGESDSKTRFAECRELLDDAFARYELYRPQVAFAAPGEIPVRLGMAARVGVRPPEEEAAPVVIERGTEPRLEVTTRIEPFVTAPVAEGDVVGETTVRLDGKETGRYRYTAAGTVERRTFASALGALLRRMVTL